MTQAPPPTSPPPQTPPLGTPPLETRAPRPADPHPADAPRLAKAIALRRRLGWLAVLAAVCALVVAGVAVIGVRQGWLSYAAGRGVLFALITPGLALLGVVLGVVTLAFAAIAAPRRGFRRGAFAVLVGGVTFWGAAQLNAQNRDAAPVHEAATDWRDPLMPSPGLLRLRGDQANAIEVAPALPEGPAGVLGRPVAEVNAKTCPAAVPVTVLGGVDAAYAKAKAALTADHMSIVTDESSSGRLEATAARGLFAQKDDVIVRVRAEGAGARIDFRSIARDGATDGGANCARLGALRSAVSR